jgi:hypothetical protein
MFFTIFTLLVVLIALTLDLAIMFYIRYRRSTATEPVEPERLVDPEGVIAIRSSAQLELTTLEVENVTARGGAFLRGFFTSTYMVFLPISFILSIVPMPIDVLSASPSGLSSWLQAVGTRLVQDSFPRTSVSIKELDQAVAVLAGATVMGLSLYSAANAQYRRWWNKTQSSMQSQACTRRGSLAGDAIQLQQLVATSQAQEIQGGQSGAS